MAWLFTSLMLENSMQIYVQLVRSNRKPNLKLSCKRRKRIQQTKGLLFFECLTKAYILRLLLNLYTILLRCIWELSNQTLQNWFYVQTQPSAKVCWCEATLRAISDIKFKPNQTNQNTHNTNANRSVSLVRRKRVYTKTQQNNWKQSNKKKKMVIGSRALPQKEKKKKKQFVDQRWTSTVCAMDGLTTSVSMSFSTTSTVRKWGTPVNGHATSSVRVVIFSPRTVSVSRLAINAPGLDLIAIRGNGNTIACEKFEEILFFFWFLIFYSNFRQDLFKWWNQSRTPSTFNVLLHQNGCVLPMLQMIERKFYSLFICYKVQRSAQIPN